jgi:hypothetical protein
MQTTNPTQSPGSSERSRMRRACAWSTCSPAARSASATCRTPWARPSPGSVHLKVLRDARLVGDRRRGRWNFYSLRPGVLEDLEASLLERKPGDAAWPYACGSADTDPCCG